ncbi:lysosome-associated membrane glycoprotein 3 isoform X2 [Cavia porcellus]|uniref:Lysosome-associated membrane glycoprotein 3 n=1 Tax=Cavia porcellus TaxID=10141 RepID=H0VSW0_CAVPO|nr:lysosome-associated membrane glycoprotein 3 isoform X2 [Cavia porcellus]
MSHEVSAGTVLFVSLAVILCAGHQVRVTGSVGSTAGPGPQPAQQVSNGLPSATSRGDHSTSQTAGETPGSPPHPTTAPATASQRSPLSSSPVVYTLATSNNSHTVSALSDATMGPSWTRHSQSPTSPPNTTPETSTPPLCLTTGKNAHHSGQTTVSETLPTADGKSTIAQKSPPANHTSGGTTATHNATPVASPTMSTPTHSITPTAAPATTVPGATLAPQPSSAKTGTYQVLNGSRICIKAEMGIQLIIQETKSVFSPRRYFNIDPNATKASGSCGFRKSNLLLNFPSGSVNFTFTKEENSYYISEIGANLTVSNPERDFQGLKSAMVMFETLAGHSFKCVSEQSILLSAQLQLKTMNVQLQAFDWEGDHFGNVDECSSDYTVVLPVIGVILVALCLLGLCVCVTRLRRRSAGYQRI